MAVSQSPTRFPFDSRKYKILKWCSRNLQTMTILEVVGAVAAAFVMMLAFSEHPKAVALFASVYVLTLIVRGGIVLRLKIGRKHLEAGIIHKFFHYMNQKLFNNLPGHRFTLFTVDPVNSSYITPYIRFRIGGRDGLRDAEESRAHYSQGMSYTGIAWQHPKRCHMHVFPNFGNREEFEFYYVNTLQVPRDAVQQISDYMIGVRQIFCYGFVDSRDQFLGVLSIDSNTEWGQPADSMPLLDEMLGILRALLETLFSRR